MRLTHQNDREYRHLRWRRWQSFLWTSVAIVVHADVSLADGEVVTYLLVVENTWSTITHPNAFPDAAHFSWLGGGTHSDQVQFWQEGELASPGMTQMAENGSIDLLANELDTEAKEGRAYQSLA